MNTQSEKQVKPLYMEQQELFRHNSRITKMGAGEINKKRCKWVQLDETIFHPKGGGQPSDEGLIHGIKVMHVHKILLDKNQVDQFEILHCFDESQELFWKEGDEVELAVDPLKRALHSKMHTAGHALAETVKEIFSILEPFHGNHDPKDGYVKFKMLKEFHSSREEMMAKIQPQLESNLHQDLLVSIIQLPSGMRAIQIGANAMACGGTHVRSLREIGPVDVTDVSINHKEQIVTVKYRLR